MYEIIENVKQREELVARVEVLDKVGKLLLLPNTEFATTKQVAEFYGVDTTVIESVYRRHSDEFQEDGFVKMTGKQVRDLLNVNVTGNNFVNKKGYIIVLTDNGEIRMANRHNALFPKRAILRVGMLLRDSEIAKEVRTQLLNIEEKVSNEVKVADITEEQMLMLAVGQAVASGNMIELLQANTKLNEFKNRHIEQLKVQVETQKPKVIAYTNIVDNGITFSATDISKRYESVKGEEVSPTLINEILLNEGYLDKQSNHTYVPTELGLKIGGVKRSFRNGTVKVTYVKWSENAVQELSSIFSKYGLVIK